VFRLWAQMAALESTIDGLTARVRMLEDWRTAGEAQFVPPAEVSKPPAQVTPIAPSASSASPARAAVGPLVSRPLEAVPLAYVSVLNGRASAGIFAVLMLYGLVVLHYGDLDT
jgi:hypothetical protein